jgi:hypothetical protein
MTNVISKIHGTVNVMEAVEWTAYVTTTAWNGWTWNGCPFVDHAPLCVEWMRTLAPPGHSFYKKLVAMQAKYPCRCNELLS